VTYVLSELVNRLVTTAEFDHGTFNELEKAGNTAFELVRSRIQELPPDQRARALMLLLSLTRQYCWGRQGDAIREALGFCDDPDIRVRSAAASVVVRGRTLVDRVPTLQTVSPSPPTRVEVDQALERALERGVDADAAQLARAFQKNEVWAELWNEPKDE
jgi:hypothetical protein